MSTDFLPLDPLGGATLRTPPGTARLYYEAFRTTGFTRPSGAAGPLWRCCPTVLSLARLIERTSSAPRRLGSDGLEGLYGASF